MTEPAAPARGSRTSDYDFELPAAQIAQLPLAQRDASRLLTVNRVTGEIAHRAFADLPRIIAPGDALVLNTTKVLRARLLGTRDSGASAEILLLRPLADGTWEAMVSPGGKLRPGRRVNIAQGFDVEIVSITERRTRIVRLDTEGDASAAIERFGHIPLPPYIARADTSADAERYQTVYARESGSVAAPTAGLHMTDALLAALDARGVRRVDVVLHVGAGTFKPVEVEDPALHPMHEERYELSAESARALNHIRETGNRIWALGTTSARALESAVRADGTFAESKGETRLFVRPPYTFRGVDKLITNFHLPRSTLLMLVAALAGYELTMRAYKEAVDAGYRFYSYGDAMAIL
ncbi:MAG TPA: tRNA preQ1(34) S-adenosylmethionine ribosyltransferase-isomerase QueA [Gemmatimonadaceae bacterium]|nr:tRNA preQ1(34) S-adenosylmethionine ribosyltransferase-isomerase QueA [Gemmatimonadaceae bacterium]